MKKMILWVMKPFKKRAIEKELKKLKERQPLPMGRKEFEEWSDRIISIASIPGATAESQKFTLSNMLLHLGPTESHKEDIFFVHSLRKFAVNQVADAIRVEIRDSVKARIAEEEKQKSKPEANTTSEQKILADGKLQAN